MGKATLFTAKDAPYLYANAAVEDLTENLVIAGGRDFTIYRFNHKGLPDTNMNRLGARQVIPYHAAKHPGGQGLGFTLVQANQVARPANMGSEVIYGGYGQVNKKTRVEAFVGRLLGDGQTDHTFGEDGLVSLSEKVLPPDSATDMWPFGLVQEPHGNYMVGVTSRRRRTASRGSCSGGLSNCPPAAEAPSGPPMPKKAMNSRDKCWKTLAIVPISSEPTPPPARPGPKAFS